MSGAPQHIDRLEPVFDGEPPADAGLLPAGTLADRLGLERLVDKTLRRAAVRAQRRPGRKILTLVMPMRGGGIAHRPPRPGCGRRRRGGCCRFG